MATSPIVPLRTGQPARRMAPPLAAADAARLQPTSGPGKITCRASGQGKITLLLYGLIGVEVTALGVTQALEAAGPVDTLDIHISSEGGDTIDGWAIYNTLARHSATTKTVTVESLAASMASIIAMVGTRIIMPSNSYLMIHNPIGICAGQAGDIRTFADFLDHMRGVMVQTYATRSGQTVQAVSDMADAETYLSADEAVRLGFADEVEQPLQVAASLDLSRLPNMPAQARAVLTGNAPAALDERAIYARHRNHRIERQKAQAAAMKARSAPAHAPASASTAGLDARAIYARMNQQRKAAQA